MLAAVSQAAQLAASFDLSVRERVRCMDNFFYLYLAALPSARPVRTAAALAELGTCMRRWQTAAGFAKKKEALVFEE